MPSLLKTTPYGFQRKAARFSYLRRFVALFMEQGTGKTITTLAVMARRWRRQGLRLAFIACPKTVRGVWKRQANEHLNIPHTVVYEIEDAKQALADDPDQLVLLVMNYESAWRVWKKIRKLGPQVAVSDESHKLKNRNSRQSNALWRIGMEAKWRMILSGTPIGKHEIDMWAQFRFLDEQAFGSHWKTFDKRYLKPCGYMGYKRKFRPTKRADFLRTVRPYVYRVRKSVLGLPPVSHVVIPVQLEPKAWKMYDTLERDLCLRLEDGRFTKTPMAVTNLIKLQTLTGGYLKDPDGNMMQVSKAKRDACVEYIEGIPGDKKVVVFCRFTDEMLELQRAIKKATGRTVALLYGKSKNKDTWQDFQDRKDPNVLLVQIATGGAGIDLFRSSYAIFYSKTYSYIEYDQALKRLDRNGQTEPVTYVHLIGEGTVDEDIDNALHKKGETSELALSFLQQRYEEKKQWLPR